VSKIIINADGVTDEMAVYLVGEVIKQGKVSNANSQYCYVSVFSDGHKVYADKTKSETFTFKVWKNETAKPN
jgi:hypothetical protein